MCQVLCWVPKTSVKPSLTIASSLGLGGGAVCSIQYSNMLCRGQYVKYTVQSYVWLCSVQYGHQLWRVQYSNTLCGFQCGNQLCRVQCGNQLSKDKDKEMKGFRQRKVDSGKFPQKILCFIFRTEGACQADNVGVRVRVVLLVCLLFVLLACK